MTEKISNPVTSSSIRRLSFHILTPDQIKRLGVVNVNTKTLYDVDSRRPNPNGPLDLRLGVSTKEGVCQTCGEGLQSCAGHFGYIDLTLPVYHIGFLKHTINVLNCICKSCGALLLGFNRKLSHAGSIQVEAVRAECKKARHCPHCRRPNGVVKKNIGFRVFHELKTGKDAAIVTEINPQTCLNIFKMINEDELAYLGLKSSPTNFIIERMLVPPSCIRPSVDMQEEGFNEDDLTVKLSEIINTNKILEENIQKGNALALINDDWDMLQLQVSLFINSDMPAVSLPCVPIRGIVQRLKGKAGRFRCNLSGKRVDFSGRTVISPDPNLSIEQVGVPEHVAKVLTIPERVTSANREFLTRMVGNGLNYPGANYVISKDERGVEFKRFLMYGKNRALRIGDVVERHLLDGDVLLFNRQPSLHRMSIMAHKAKVHQHKTFRFNECVCSAYNADFDGDEMNIHLPQTQEARAEALELMGTRNNICTARNGEPLLSCTQDFLTSTYILTEKSVFFARERFAQLCAYAVYGRRWRITAQPAILAPVELFTGKQLYEVVIQSAIGNGADGKSTGFVNLDARNRSYKSDDHQNEGHVLIKNSVYLKGRFDKAIIGGENRKGSLIYQLMKISRGCAVAAMNSISRVSVRYLAETGFSIGLDDVYPSERLIREKNRIVDAGFRQVEQLIAGGTDCDAASLEMEISMVLSRIREECGNTCIDELGRRNSPIIMQECGSKGSKINVSQMIACVGQQIISGHRIPEGMHGRTLPHFSMGSLQPESRGFVLNSFFSGMHSYEFFFHAVSGREGLVDTAVKTAETGYMQRRLMKALEDLSIKYDYTVRNSFDDLVQFCYGEDGVEPLRNEEECFLPWIFDACVSRFAQRRAQTSPTYNFLGRDFDFSAFLHAQLFGGAFDNAFFIDGRTMAALEQLRLARAAGASSVTATAARTVAAGSTPAGTSERAIRLIGNVVNDHFIKKLISFVTKNADASFFHHGSFYRYFQDRSLIADFLESLLSSILCMAIEPGTAVGAIAGQSIGEPGTQMTLKTFHFAGVASMNITLGVPRLKEIINAAVNIATPIINARLQMRGLESARIIKGRIEKVLFGDICSRITHTVSAEGVVMLFEVDTGLLRSLRLEISLEGIRARMLKMLKTTAIDVAGSAIRYTIKRARENTLFSREKIKKQILAVRVCGLDSVSRVVINCLSQDGEAYELLVEGTGLCKILGVPGIEPYGTSSNNVMEVRETLGIEAARALIIGEVEYTMGKHGIKIDHRHIMLLSDMMCFKGDVLGITRFGIGKMRTSTLMLASFEQTADYLFNAAAQDKIEEVGGVSESIIMGIPISLGTGMVELLWDDR